MQVGIIGRGMVGGAVEQCFKQAHQVISYDIKDAIDTRPQMYAECSVVFVCVPTPTLEDWNQDLEYLYQAIEHLSVHSFKGEVCIKSTVLPGTCSDIQAEFSDLFITHNPEFLRERCAAEDFKNQKAVIIGSSLEPGEYWTLKSADAYREWGQVPIIHVTLDQAESAKYMHNCFLAMKVAIFNEFYLILGDETFNAAKKAMLAATNTIGDNHTQVPGPDGLLGFGGSCFPKDTKAFSRWVKDVSQDDCDILDMCIEKNERVRE